MSKKPTTFEYALELFKTKKPPKDNVITIQRNTTTSKYQFYMLARAYSMKIGVRPQFYTYERNKSFADQIKGVIEEHSVFNTFEQRLFVLEGFYNRWVLDLLPAPNTFIVAETDNGDYAAVPFSYKEAKNFLRILMDLNRMRRSDFTLRGIISKDWGSKQSFEEIETLLNKAHLMKWTEEDLEAELTSSDWNNALTVLKRGTAAEINDFIHKFNPTWFLRRVTKNLSDLIYYRSLIQMGYEHDAVVKTLDLHPRSLRARELEDVNKMYTNEDVTLIAERLLEMNNLTQRYPELGVELLSFNSPTRLRK